LTPEFEKTKENAMEKSSGDNNKNQRAPLDSVNDEPPKTRFRSTGNYVGMTVIPWRNIWSSLAVAKLRGRTQMIDVFYDRLFEEALFDDRGAWSPLIR